MNFQSKITQSISYGILEKIFRLIIIFVTNIVIIRSLGPRDYGAYITIINLVTILGHVGQLGVGPNSLRQIILDPKIERKMINSAYSLRLVTSFVLFFVIALISGILWFFSGQPQEFLLSAMILGSLVLAQPLPLTQRTQFESRTELRYYTVATLKSLCLGVPAKIIAAASGLGIMWVSVAQAMEYFLGKILVKSEAKSRGYPKSIFKKSYLDSHLLKKGFPFLVGGLFSILMWRIDVLMLSKMKGTAEAGIYASAVRMVEVYLFLPAVFTAACSPALLNQKIKKMFYFSDLFKQLLQTLAFCGWVVCILTLLFGEMIILTFFGPDYSGAVQVLKCHALFAPVFMNFLAMDQLMGIADQGFTRLWILVGGLISNFLLGLLLIPSYGGLGAAASTGTSVVIAAFILPAFFTQVKSVVPKQIKAVIIPNPLGLIKYLSKNQQPSTN